MAGMNTVLFVVVSEILKKSLHSQEKPVTGLMLRLIGGRVPKMRIMPAFLRRKKRVLDIFLIAQPPLWATICDRCDFMFWSTLVEGNLFPLVCPICGQVQNEG
jgi:hypothetical protein